MGLSEEGEENIFNRFEEICLDLNMDALTKDEAWQNYMKTLTNFSLEGDQMHWLACSLYEACRRSSVPTVGTGIVEGNCVSLTRLLRSSKFSLIQFFNKMRKWSDMASLPQAFRDKIDKLERNFAVSTVIFKKFEPIFLDIFVNPAQELPRQQRGRKQRRFPCSAHELFNFAWTVFVQVKGNFPAISDDLVNSYHLLLCCVDWVFSNAVLCARKDLLNPEFEGLPEDFHSPAWKAEGPAPCIMGLLCAKHDGLVVEAKTIKEHWWRPHIRRLFEKKILKGKGENLAGILDIGNFEENSKTMSNMYEEFVLSVGDFDERIFLGETANEELGTPGGSQQDLAHLMQAKRAQLNTQFDENKTLAPTTPLTGRRYLKEKDMTSVTPVSTATQSVSRLQSLLAGCKTSPSDALMELFESCKQNPMEQTVTRVKEMGETFCNHYAKSEAQHSGAALDFGRKRLQLGESLYFKTLEGILDGERKRLLNSGSTQNIDLTGLLENDFFHRSLFACCLEIVIFSYNSQRTFPWIVDIFELSPYHFYKVIEIIIRAEKGLSRDVVKHLNHIEESILEAHAWRSDSPLWEALKDTVVPNCEEVMPGHQMDKNGPMSKLLPSLAKHPRLRSLVGDIKTINKTSTPTPASTSPVAPMAADRFSSPNPGNAKRRLFGLGPSSSSAVTTLAYGATSNSSIVISSASGAPLITGAAAKSILLSQLRGGTADSVVVSNKTASSMAPTSVASTSPSPLMAATFSTATVVAPPVAATASTTTSASTVSSASTISSASTSTGPDAKPQPAIVAMMEDGRQILVPVQISQPTAPTSPTPGLREPLTGTTVAQRGNAKFQVNVTLPEGGQVVDHTYNKPKKTGSLALFFRKVYHLCCVRLRDLFEKLDLDSAELLQKVWTCLEHCLVTYPSLMGDRHLDQLVMCSIYLIAKVTEQPLTFQTIMRCYRLQPQAQSHVYRSVLLSGRQRHGSGSSDSSKSNEGSGSSSPINVEVKTEAGVQTKKPLVRSSSTLPHPHPGSQPPTPTHWAEVEEERGDLINFYNLVFLKKIRSFALKFADKGGLEALNMPKLSPLPTVRCLRASPRRLSSHHSVFISPHNPLTVPSLANNNNGGMRAALSYSIDCSPSKDLQAINRMIKANTSHSKRCLEVDHDTVQSPAKRVALPYIIRRLTGLTTVIENNPQ